MRKDNTGSKFMLFLMVWAIVYIFLLIFTLEVFGIIFGFETSAVLATPWAMIAYQLMMLVLPLMVWMLVKNEPFKPIFPACKLGGKNIIIIVALSFLFQPVIMTMSGITSLFFTNDVAELMSTIQQQPFLLQILAIAVAPAICEELVFRGYIQSKYRDRTIKRAALINGLFFAIIHLNLQQFMYAFALGVVFAYMVHYTRSIWAAIIPHFIVNATQVTLSRWAFASQYADPQVDELFAALPVSPEVLAIIIFGVISLCLSPVIIILFKEFFKHNKERFFGYEDVHGLDSPPPPPPIHGYEYQIDDTDLPEWARLQHGSPRPMPDMLPDTPPYMPDEKSSRVDPYTIAVVVMFLAYAALMVLL